MKIDFSPLIKALDSFIAKADDDLKDQLDDEGFTEPKETVDGINNLEDALTDLFEQEKAVALKILADADDGDIEGAVKQILDTLSENATIRDAMEAVFQEELETTVRNLATSYMKNLDKDVAFSTFTDRTTDWIQSWSSDLADIMHLSTNEGLEDVLSTALKKGKSVDKVTQELQDWYGFSRSRARKTAITEMLTAHSAAANEAFRQSPAVEKKRWRHTGAYKNTPRPNHVAMDGTEVLKTEPFELTGADGSTYYPDYPRDPVLPASERVNCHCIVQAVTNSDILGLSAEEKRALQQDAIDDDNGQWEKTLDQKNKEKAGIDENTVHLDWIKTKSQADQIKYWGGGAAGKSRWALTESGVISTDSDLDRLFKTGKSGTKIKRSLQELSDDGIMTVSGTTLTHATKGEFTKLGNTKLPASIKNGGRPSAGGHAQSGIDELQTRGWRYEITKTYDNGVRIGNSLDHSKKFRRSGSQMSWFPEEWDEDKILLAGTSVSNTPDLTEELVTQAGDVSGKRLTGLYDGVSVCVTLDVNGKVVTVYPKNEQ